MLSISGVLGRIRGPRTQIKPLPPKDSERVIKDLERAQRESGQTIGILQKGKTWCDLQGALQAGNNLEQVLAKGVSIGHASSLTATGNLLTSLLSNDSFVRFLQQEQIVIHVEPDANYSGRLKKVFEGQHLPHYALHADVIAEPLGKDPHTETISEAVAYAFLSRILQNIESCPEDIAAIEGGHKVLVPGNDSKAEKYFSENISPQLAIAQLAGTHYNALTESESLITSIIAVLIGLGGESSVHHIFENSEGIGPAIARFLTLGTVDVLDNTAGETGAVISDVRARGGKISKKDVFGTENLGKIIIQILRGCKFEGEVGPIIRKALIGALKGATSGAFLNIPVSAALSSNLPIGARAIAGGTGTVGTSLSIFFNLRTTLRQCYFTALHLIKTGQIKIPQECKTEKEKKQYALTVAKLEILARLGNRSSLRALVAAPIMSGSVLASEAIGVPREISQMIYMGLSAPAENLLRVLFTSYCLRVLAPSSHEFLTDKIASGIELSPADIEHGLSIRPIEKGIFWLINRRNNPAKKFGGVSVREL